MSLLEAIRTASLKKARIVNDASAPKLHTEFDELSKGYDESVLAANIENWASLLGPDLTPETLFVPLEKEHATELMKAYEALETKKEAVQAAARSYTQTRRTSEPLNEHERSLLSSLGSKIQEAIDKLSGDGAVDGRGCFVKLSSRSAKDAAARTGVFKAFYLDAIASRGKVEGNEKLRLLCEAEGAALRFNDAASIIRAFVLSERVWQDMTLALRHPERWQQNIVFRKWEPVPIDMEFRTFVFSNRMTAISQYAYQLYSSRLNNPVVKQKVQVAITTTFESRLRDVFAANGFGACVVDVGVIPPEEGIEDESKGIENWRVIVIEINPFQETTDGALFSWRQERELLEGKHNGEGEGNVVMRINEKERPGALVMVPKGWRDVVEEVENGIP